MYIAILGWGSLITRPGSIESTIFTQNGPYLPIQFSRISKYGSVTLVKDFYNGKFIQTWSALSLHKNLKEAINNLKQREQTTEDFIGYYNHLDFTFRIIEHKDTTTTIYRGKILSFYPFTSTTELPQCVLNLLSQIVDWCLSMYMDAVIWTELPPNFMEKTILPWSFTNLCYYLHNLDKSVKVRSADYIFHIPRNVSNELSASALLSLLK